MAPYSRRFIESGARGDEAIDADSGAIFATWLRVESLFPAGVGRSVVISVRIRRVVRRAGTGLTPDRFRVETRPLIDFYHVVVVEVALENVLIAVVFTARFVNMFINKLDEGPRIPLTLMMHASWTSLWIVFQKGLASRLC